MASTAEIAKRYFAALSAHDLDAATACWRPGAIDRLVAELGPSVVWAGHADPVSGDVAGQLQQAAAAPL
jgi:ketosteroid isomerase-like protein